MAIQSCYECNKDISTKAIICPQCGAPQNPVSGLMDKAKGFLSKNLKKIEKELEMKRTEKEMERKIEEDMPNLLQDMHHGDLSSRLENFDLSRALIKNMMEEMEIEDTLYWEIIVKMKLEEILEIKKEEQERKEEDSKTILSRFRDLSK